MKTLSDVELDEIILKWQLHWRTEKLYESRAASIDANMRYSLARAILKYLQTRETLEKPSKKQILEIAKKHCKAEHCQASFYKGYRLALEEK
jgi:hypothetical protein